MIDATYYDLVEWLLMVNSVAPSTQQRRYARMAIQSAYRDLMAAHDWNCMRGLGKLTVNGAYSTGTVTFDYTGGTYERQLTLTGGTWPAWASNGMIWINNVIYKVEDVKSSTVLTFAANDTPSADITTGQAYSIVRESYIVPCALLRMDGFCSLTNYTEPGYLPLNKWPTHRRSVHTGSVCYFTIDGSDEYFQKSSIRIGPPPSQDETFEYSYVRKPRPLRVEGDYAGIVTGSNASTTITGSGTAFSALHPGCVFRIGSDGTNVPTASWGDHPGIEDRIVISVESSISLTLDAAPTNSFAGMKYLLTDPLDINPDVMLTALQYLAVAQYGMLNNTGDSERYNLDSAAERETLKCMAADVQWRGSVNRYGYRYDPMLDWRSDSA